MENLDLKDLGGKPAKRKKSLKRFRAIILYRAYAHFVSDKENTYVGALWFFLDPALSAGAYLIISMFFRHRAGDMAAFIIIGSFVWQMFAASIGTMAGAIAANKSVIQQIYLPKIIFPISELINSTIEYLCSLLLLVVGLIIAGYLPGISLLLLPFIVVLHLFLCLGVGLPLAAVTPFFSDIKEAVKGILRLMGFLSGIFFVGSSLASPVKFYFYLNPMAHVLDMYRAILLHHSWPSLFSVIYVFLFGLAFFVLGFWLINKFDRHYVKALSK